MTRFCINKALPFIGVMLICHFSVAAVTGDNGPGDRISVGGYVKGIPIVAVDRHFSNPQFHHIFHNRINVSIEISSGLELSLGGRNRILYNQMFEDIPELKERFDMDDGLMDLSWVWLQDNAWLGHSQADRLYLSWRRAGWNVRAGRQRINWGVNLVSNPNDLFNTYSFFDFDYPERPGTDAIRIQRFTGHASGGELAISPAKETQEMVVATRVFFQKWGYDIQALGGYYRNRTAIGAGWAGNLGGAGFKGEATWFYHIPKTTNKHRGNVVAAAGLDYMLPGGTFCVVELLYNGGYEQTSGQVLDISQPLQPDNIMFSKYAATISADHMFSPLITGSLAVMVMPDVKALFIAPKIQWSLFTNMNLEMMAQIFTGGEKGTILHQYNGTSWITSLSYAF